MDKDLEKLLSHVIEPQDEDDWLNFDKYPQQCKRSYPTPVYMAWNEKGFNNSIDLAKNKLSPLIKYLPNDFVVEKIRSFIMDAYKNPHVKDISKLQAEFDEDHLALQNIVVKLYYTDIDKDFIDSNLFSLYKPEFFCKKYIEPYLENCTPNQWEKSIKHVFSYEDIGQPFVILVLKNIAIYQKEHDVNDNIVKERAEEILNTICVIMGLKYKAQNFSEYFKRSLQAYSIFTQEMEPKMISDAGKINYNYFKEPAYITEEIVNNRIMKLFSYQNKLKEKVKKSINWLGKSLITENLDDSFLQVAISLECLLFRKEKTLVTPSLTFSLSEALTLLVETEQKQRILIFNDIKNMYALRCSIVHSGQGNITFNTYNRFFGYVNRGIQKLLDLSEEKSWNSIDNLYKYIEEHRFN